MMTIVLPLTTAGANRETNPRRGYESGQAIPITPTGSWIFTVAPYSVVSCQIKSNFEINKVILINESLTIMIKTFVKISSKDTF